MFTFKLPFAFIDAPKLAPIPTPIFGIFKFRLFPFEFTDAPKLAPIGGKPPPGIAGEAPGDDVGSAGGAGVPGAGGIAGEAPGDDGGSAGGAGAPGRAGGGGTAGGFGANSKGWACVRSAAAWIRGRRR